MSVGPAFPTDVGWFFFVVQMVANVGRKNNPLYVCGCTFLSFCTHIHMFWDRCTWEDWCRTHDWSLVWSSRSDVSKDVRYGHHILLLCDPHVCNTWVQRSSCKIKGGLMRGHPCSRESPSISGIPRPCGTFARHQCMHHHGLQKCTTNV